MKLSCGQLTLEYCLKTHESELQDLWDLYIRVGGHIRISFIGKVIYEEGSGFSLVEWAVQLYNWCIQLEGSHGDFNYVTMDNDPSIVRLWFRLIDHEWHIGSGERQLSQFPIDPYEFNCLAEKFCRALHQEVFEKYSVDINMLFHNSEGSGFDDPLLKVQQLSAFVPCRLLR